MKASKNKTIIDFIMIIAGCLIYSTGIALFLSPNELAPGGVSGIAIIISGVTGVATGLLILILNIPLLIVGFIVFGKEFLSKTVIATVLSSLLVYLIELLFPNYLPVTSDPLLAAAAGGALLALGMGLVFRHGGTTGGTDIVTKLLRKKFRSIPTGKIFMAVDSLIIISSAIVSGDINKALYAGISLVISSILLDAVLYGTDGAKMLIIISEYPEKIASRIMSELDVGITFLDGSGAYTKDNKNIIMCVVKKHVFYKVKDIVRDEDESAFVVVSGADEIFGEGYKIHGAEEL